MMLLPKSQNDRERLSRLEDELENLLCAVDPVESPFSLASFHDIAAKIEGLKSGKPNRQESADEPEVGHG